MTRQKLPQNDGVPVTLRTLIAARVAALNEAGEFRVSAIAADPVVSELIYALELLAVPVREAA